MIALLDYIKNDHRWDSTQLMLEKALKYEHDLKSLKWLIKVTNIVPENEKVQKLFMRFCCVFTK